MLSGIKAVAGEHLHQAGCLPLWQEAGLSEQAVRFACWKAAHLQVLPAWHLQARDPHTGLNCLKQACPVGVLQAHELHGLLASGLKSGEVRPLPVTVFPRTDAEEAFRYLASGKLCHSQND